MKECPHTSPVSETDRTTACPVRFARKFVLCKTTLSRRITEPLWLGDSAQGGQSGRAAGRPRRQTRRPPTGRAADATEFQHWHRNAGYISPELSQEHARYILTHAHPRTPRTCIRIQFVNRLHWCGNNDPQRPASRLCHPAVSSIAYDAGAAPFA